jgi:hypothetical protein
LNSDDGCIFFNGVIPSEAVVQRSDLPIYSYTVPLRGRSLGPLVKARAFGMTPGMRIEFKTDSPPRHLISPEGTRDSRQPLVQGAKNRRRMTKPVYNRCRFRRR